MPDYAAFFRGINVGGKHIVPMAELRALFEGAGATEVRSYLQSGNVVFPRAELAPRTRRHEHGTQLAYGHGPPRHARRGALNAQGVPVSGAAAGVA